MEEGKSKEKLGGKKSAASKPEGRKKRSELTSSNPYCYEGSTSTRVKRVVHREIGLLMLILAAQTLSDMGLVSTPLSTELMSDTHYYSGRPSTQAEQDFYSEYSSCGGQEKCMLYADKEDGLTPSITDDSEHGDEDDEEYERAARHYVAARRRHSLQRFNTDADVWQNVFEFLPWQDVLKVRGVSRFHFLESLPFAAVLRMPSTGAPAVFIPCRENLDARDAADEAALQRAPAEPWMCGQCGLFNEDRATCSNVHCGVSRPARGQRVFFGQLRRDGTVPMVRWLMNSVFNAPREALVMVENHRNGRTGRGKGCAWPTIRGAATLARVMRSHHRLFFDTVGGVEGVWWVPEDGASMAALDAESVRRFASGGKAAPQRHMPRGTMVVELPSAASSSGSTNSPSAKPQACKAEQPPPYALTPSYAAEPYADMYAEGWYADASPMAPQFPYYGDFVVYESASRWRHNPYCPVVYGEGDE